MYQFIKWHIVPPLYSKVGYIINVIKGANMQLNPIGSNMTEVETSEARILFSYRTPVAAYVYGEGVPIAGEMYRGFVRTAKWWSVTTSRHINKWLDGGTAEEVSQTYLDNLV